MTGSKSESYKAAGVDVEAGYAAVALMKQHAEKTFTKGVIGSLGGFGGLFMPDLSHIKKPVLVSGTDGVGTKLKIAFLMNKHHTVGIDCVAMCVNDIICSGASPLFFLDYLAVGKLLPEVAAEIVSGVAEGCAQAECALIGGETAEMPGFYPAGEYDLAGFCVGCVDYDSIIDGKKQTPGDVLIGIASSGIHSNGYSLVRSVVKPDEKNVLEYEPSLSNTMGEALLTPTRIYVKAVKALMGRVLVKSLCHITGGGFYENVPRMLQKSVKAVILKNSFPRPAIFDYLMQKGNIPERDMYNTFNMGIGMIAAVDKNDADRALACLKNAGEEAFVIGELQSGSGEAEVV